MGNILADDSQYDTENRRKIGIDKDAFRKLKKVIRIKKDCWTAM